MYQPPSAITARVRAQRSVLTVHPDATASFEFPTLRRWVLAYDRTMCVEFQKILAENGINEGTLFRDVDSVARYVAWLYKWDFGSNLQVPRSRRAGRRSRYPNA